MNKGKYIALGALIPLTLWIVWQVITVTIAIVQAIIALGKYG